MLLYIKKLSNFLNLIAEKVVILLVSVLTIITTGGVLYRYVLKSPLMWLYETTVLIFAWTVFMGASIAFKRHEHIRLDFLVDALEKKGKGKGVKVLISLLILFFLVLVMVKGVDIVSNTMAQKYNTIDVSLAWFYLSFPISSIFSFVHVLDKTLDIITEKKKGERSWAGF